MTSEDAELLLPPVMQVKVVSFHPIKPELIGLLSPGSVNIFAGVS